MFRGQSPSSVQRRAQAQGRPRLALAVADLALLWRNSIRFTTAFVVAAFPFVFMIDEAVESSFSPVLPLLGVLVAILVGVPPLVVELRTRRIRNLERLRARVLRGTQTSWACLGLSFVWLVFWFSWGL